jgi:hypothetical protein
MGRHETINILNGPLCGVDIPHVLFPCYQYLCMVKMLCTSLIPLHGFM